MRRVQSGNTTFLFISLFLMLLSLFMVLVGQGEFKTKNIGSVLDSVKDTFAGQMYTHKETPFTSKRFREVLQGLTHKNFKTDAIVPISSGEYTLLDFKTADFFADSKADLSEKGLAFTADMAALLKEGTLEVTAVLGGSFLKDNKASKPSYDLAASRLEKYVQTLMMKGADAKSLSIAFDDEDVSRFRLMLRVKPKS